MKERKPMEPDELMRREFKALSKCVKNLLIDNKNFQGDWDKRGYYFEHHNLPSYVQGPLKDHAEFIIEKIDQLGELVVDYVKSYEDELAGAKIPKYPDGKVSKLP
jgi:hypothetical protein